MSKSKFSHVRIAGITGVVPEKCINIDDEIQFYGGDAKLLERNKKILGLGTRHVVDDRTSLCDLCQAAAEDLIQGMKLDRQSIDALIVASTSHDFHCPATACILQGRLQLNTECACYDQAGLGCTAYVHAIWQAHALVESGAVKRCLVLAGEIGSVRSDRRNRNVNMLFGDAAVATLVEYTSDEWPSWFYLGTDGKGWKNIVAPAGGYNLPVQKDIVDLEIRDDDGNVWHLWDDLLKGMSVFRFTTVAGPRSINEILAFSGKSVDDVDYFALHQANRQIVRTVANYAGIPREKYSSDAFSRYGNCASAAVATDILTILARNKIRMCCMSTFGVGLSWGAAIVDFSATKAFGFRDYRSSDSAMTREQRINAWIEYYRTGNDFEE